jgi:two-component system chemotaxis sensor kinase CheA
MDMNQYLEIFIEETKEHLQSLNQSLLQLEQNPEDAAMLNEIFRVAHTLKGMSGTMGYTRMAKLTHQMENVLHAIRSNELKISTKLIDILFKCLDALENYLNCIVNTNNEGSNEYTSIIVSLNGFMEGKEVEVQEGEEKSKVLEPKQSNDGIDKSNEFDNLVLNQYEQNVVNRAYESKINAYAIKISLNKGCLLKSARAFIIFQTLERHGEIVKAIPPVQEIEDEKFDFEFTVAIVSKISAEQYLSELNSISEVENIAISVLLPKGNYDSSVEERVATNKDIKMFANDAEDTSKEEVDDQKSKASSKARTGKTVRVDIERLDTLMNLVGELIITKTRLEGIEIGIKSQEYNENLEYLERITTNLNDAVMKVRMVPVETVFNRFPRMIRDISKDLGKEINLKMSGEETELDRTVIDEIGDPLIHLLRNSVDHGIEPLEKRHELGKPMTGNINLRAYQSGNNVIIEVEDDGAGINIEKVKKKAVERGIISKELANSMTQQDIIDLLFKPSFSTADAITNLSGRGVGLDVVKTKIESLGGRVEVETILGKGSKFVIRLPLTLAIYQALLVVVGSEKFAIPLSSIYQIINIKQSEVKMVQKQEVMLLRNMVVPIVRIADVLDVPKSEVEQKQYTIVIVRKGEKLSGFMVDSVIGQQEIVIKSLGKMLTGIKSIAGATILGDGNVALIVDVNSLA